ncbi:MAG TPA: 5'-deoxynucleotidase, partial [Trueperaceae bacterium]|nr:5'-deoxynucleotidase [Trueperaceae bacterium]
HVANHAFAYLARLKFILRWGLMRNTRTENTQEHSLQVAMIAHALAVIANRLYGGAFDPERTALLAVFHDAEEVITGDVPTPIKYFNPAIADAMDGIRTVARRRLLAMFPDALRADYRPLLVPVEADAAEWRLVKLADRVAAYLKCVEEAKAGNGEFVRAEQALLAELARADEPALGYFMETFVPSFQLTLDELG